MREIREAVCVVATYVVKIRYTWHIIFKGKGSSAIDTVPFSKTIFNANISDKKYPFRDADVNLVIDRQKAFPCLY